MPLRGQAASADLGQRLGLGRDERPVLGVFGPLLDPARQDVDLGRAEPVARLPGRHPQRCRLPR